MHSHGNMKDFQAKGGMLSVSPPHSHTQAYANYDRNAVKSTGFPVPKTCAS